jgi:hypothetical protein
MKHLSGWAREAKAHWQKYRPKMFNELQQSGTLNESLENAAKRAEDQYVASVQNGMHPLEAQSEAKRQHLFLPSEEDQSELGVDPNRLPDPASLITTPGVRRRKSAQRPN